MKTISFIIFFVSILSLTSCSGNSNEDVKKEEKITVKGADGTEYESYQECCSMNDYDAAHRYLAKMENAGKSIHEASDYVFQQEALYLMSIGDEASKKRILYLLKEEGGNNDSRVAMLIDLAIDEDDEEFVKKLANQYTAYCSDENLRKVVEYLDGKDNGENEKYLFSLLKKIEKHDTLINYAIKKNNKEIILKEASTGLSLGNTELINALASLKDKECSELIIGLLTERESSISKKPQMGTIRFGDTGPTYNFEKMCEKHSSSIKDFNRNCQTILGIAIKNNNQYLAQRAVFKFRTNINVEERGWVNDNYVYIVTSDNDDINTAKATYQEAVKSGAFR